MTRVFAVDPLGAHGGRTVKVELGRKFATVTLDRDDYAYRAAAEGREDAELAPEFAAAAKRCVNAACGYLWVHGYAGDFLYGAGSSFVTLFVPFELADQAAKALRAAELEGDLTGIGALTSQMAVPLDAWLAPGERELRQGIDFWTSPTAFVKYLRAQANARGLRLNGRALPGAVWVRPTMPRSRRELLREFPDQFKSYTDPAPYEQHEWSEDDPVRPEVDREPASWREPTPVVAIATASKPEPVQECPCGTARAPAEFEQLQHRRAHLNWSIGLPVPRNVFWPAGQVALVTGTSPPAWRRLAYASAVLPRRENHYDSASFAVGDGEPSDRNARAYLLNDGGRVVGFVSVFDEIAVRWQAFDAAPQPQSSIRERPVINVIFTAALWRRRGVGRTLVEAVATDAGIDVTELAWNGPLSVGGEALAKSISPLGIWHA